ncbi:MAG TPA: hypothetical protein VI076_05460 [Actinopolymorphaceae bacterium]
MTRSGHREGAARAVATVAALGLALPVAGASAAYASNDWHRPKPVTAEEPGWDVSGAQGSEWHRKKPVAPSDAPVWTVASGPEGAPGWTVSAPRADNSWGDNTWGLTSGPDEEPGWD